MRYCRSRSTVWFGVDISSFLGLTVTVVGQLQRRCIRGPNRNSTTKHDGIPTAIDRRLSFWLWISYTSSKRCPSAPPSADADAYTRTQIYRSLWRDGHTYYVLVRSHISSEASDWVIFHSRSKPVILTRIDLCCHIPSEIHRICLWASCFRSSWLRDPPMARFSCFASL